MPWGAVMQLGGLIYEDMFTTETENPENNFCAEGLENCWFAQQRERIMKEESLEGLRLGDKDEDGVEGRSSSPQKALKNLKNREPGETATCSTPAACS